MAAKKKEKVPYAQMTRKDPGYEHPDDPKPVHPAQMKERARAIQEGRLIAPARDTLALEAKKEAAEKEAKEAAKAATKAK